MITCTVLTILYVCSLYLTGGDGDRDDPVVIKHRLVGVVISTVMAVFVSGIQSTSLSLGSHLYGFVWGLAVTLAVYSFGLFRMRLRGTVDNFKVESWGNARNLIIGPVSEEVVFRGCFGRILESSGYSRFVTVLIATMLFWLAHVHHFWGQFSLSKNRARALISIAAQSAYTAVFSIIAFLLYYKSGSLLACLSAHMTCNALQIPQFKSSQEFVICSVVAVLVFILG